MPHSSNASNASTEEYGAMEVEPTGVDVAGFPPASMEEGGAPTEVDTEEGALSAQYDYTEFLPTPTETQDRGGVCDCEQSCNAE